MIETIEEFADRIIRNGSLGVSPFLVDGQTRLQLINLKNGHEKFCFHNLGYGSEQWLAWKNPKWVGPVYAEIEKKIAAATFNPPLTEIKSEETKGALIDLAQKAISSLPLNNLEWDGLWFAKGGELYFEVQNGEAFRIDDDGYRIGVSCPVTSTGWISSQECWLDESRRGDAPTFTFLGNTIRWPKPKGRARNLDESNQPVGELS